MLMRANGFVVLLVVTVAVVASAMYLVKRDTGGAAPQVGALVFPDLLGRINDVVQVDVRASDDFSLERAGQSWVAPRRDGYPLDGDKVHNLLVGAAGMERLEPKTGDPARFDELGLRDPGDEGSRATEITLLASGGEQLAQVIVGTGRPAKGDPNRTEYFVRLPGEQNSWLVRGNLPRNVDELTDWLERRIVALSAGRIARVEVLHPHGERVTALRDSPGESDFRYQQLSDGAQLKGSWVINDLGRVLTDLMLEDVLAQAQAGEPGEDALEATTETFDGLRVRLRVWRDGARTLAALRAEFDEALVRVDGGDAPADALRPAEEVRDEAAQLDARWRDWVYVVPDYKGDYIRRQQQDLLKEPEPASEPAAAPAVSEPALLPPAQEGGATPDAPDAAPDAAPGESTQTPAS